MALQDLTPQLRTRLSRMERTVGWFVFLATALLLFGFGYYLYHTAENKGWFKIKVQFHTYVQSSAGLSVGDKVYMMGFPVGEITLIKAMPPRDLHNVRIEFQIVDPYFRYIWTGGSVVKVNAASFLGRQLEVTRATNGYAICVTQPVTVFSNLDELAQNIEAQPGQWQLAQEVFDQNTNLLFHAYDFLDSSNLPVISQLKPDSITAYRNTEPDRHKVVASWHPHSHRYENFSPVDDTAWLKANESPAVSDQLQAMVSQVQDALPGILALTNKVAAVLNNAAMATSNLNTTIASAQPLLNNVAAISAELREPGSPIIWALGTNGNWQLQTALTNANTLLGNSDSNLDQLTSQIGLTLINVANITSNLNAQVQANSNMLFSISKIVTDSDNFVQGLKRHWLLRSAFKKENKAADKAAAKK
ncbi:MAG TPA: MlaD family protein [Candidatus Acidoferrum sp.]|nr:MlaD family protein [Candidatus Acidoferrum sp.]